MTYLLGVVGLGVLVLGADLLVRGGSRLAASLGVPPLIIGLTLVAFGTSAPELVVSLQAAVGGHGDIATGNVVGSNIANLALILGLAALVRPIATHLSLLRRDVPLAVLATALISIFALNGWVGRLEGGVLFAGLVIYVAWTLRGARLGKGEYPVPVDIVVPTGIEHLRRGRTMALLLALLGLALLVVGSRLFVEGAVSLARLLGWSEAVIGLTIVAVGTSFPELATSLVAAARGEGDISAGNVVGSNLFNSLGILGTSALVQPLGPLSISRVDLAVMLGLTVLLWPMLRTGHRIDRWEGALLVAIYATYVAMLLT